MKIFFSFLLVCFISSSILGQDKLINPSLIQSNNNNSIDLEKCGTPDPTAKQYAYTRDVIATYSLNENSGVTAIPIRAVIVRETGGTGGVSVEDLNIGLANLNNHYLDAGIEYYYTYDSPVYLDNSTYYDFDKTEESAMFAAANEVADASNICFVNEVCSGANCNIAGYAYYPNNTQTATRIVMRNSVTAAYDNGTYVHEFGHWFNLYHTHQDTENGNLDPDAEHVPRTGGNSNCTTAGDLLCDTESDPNGSNTVSCVFVNDGNSTQDVHGNTYAPDIANIMSYYSDGCGGYFTSDQSTRIAQGLIERQGYGSFPLNRAPATVADASGLSLTYVPNSYSIQLDWTDNANNEMGYIIERSSTSSSSGFQAIQYGGVGSNTSTFLDNGLSSNTTYWYRVKASNDDPDDYSNVASYTTGLVFCIPSYQSNSCNQGNGIGISRFELEDSGNNSLIDNNNGVCSELTNYSSTISATVTAGALYNYEVTRLDGYPQSVALYVDLNLDGDFDDVDEQVYQGAVSTYSGSFTLPATATNGTTTLRVRTKYNATITSPCAYNDFGETEDYELVVSGGLPVTLAYFDGKKNRNSIKLNWMTSSEINNDYFSLERSEDGISFFEIARINGAGTSQIDSYYEYDDMINKNGSYYYRLKQVDFNGKFEFSNIKFFEFQDVIIATSIYPNPTKNKLNVILHSNITDAFYIDIIDLNGNTVINQKRELNKGENTFIVNVQDLASGIYFARIRSSIDRQALRFIIQ